MALRAVAASLARLALVLTAAAACGAAPAIPSTDPSATAAGTVAPPISPRAIPELTPVPGSGPPSALLTEPSGLGSAGDLGTFAWDGMSSDAPWLPGEDAGGVRRGDPLALTFGPPVEPTSWQARWARIVGGQPQLPIDGGAGTGSRIGIAAPDEAGSWSLQLVARFGEGRDAAWYWRVEIVP